MFLIMGINNGRKRLDFSQSLMCPCCGRYGQLEIIKTYTYFMLFFIPLFRWNKRYFVNISCCGSSCEISAELGRAIEKGQISRINPEDLNFASQGSKNRYYNNAGGYYRSAGTPSESGPISSRANMASDAPQPSFANSYIDSDGLKRVKIKTCNACGYETGEDFSFCPKCGKPL